MSTRYFSNSQGNCWRFSTDGRLAERYSEGEWKPSKLRLHPLLSAIERGIITTVVETDECGTRLDGLEFKPEDTADLDHLLAAAIREKEPATGLRGDPHQHWDLDSTRFSEVEILGWMARHRWFGTMEEAKLAMEDASYVHQFRPEIPDKDALLLKPSWFIRVHTFSGHVIAGMRFTPSDGITLIRHFTEEVFLRATLSENDNPPSC